MTLVLRQFGDTDDGKVWQLGLVSRTAGHRNWFVQMLRRVLLAFPSRAGVEKWCWCGRSLRYGGGVPGVDGWC